MGTHLPPKGTSPIFGPCLLWQNGCMYQDITWYGVRPQPRRHCVRWGPSSPPLKRHSPNFRPMSVVCQTAGWTKMSLGMELGLGLLPRRLFVRWGPSSPRKKGTVPHPIFGPCLLWPNGWMDEDATWYGSRPKPRPRSHCIRRGPSWHSSRPLFSAHVYCGHGRPSQLLLSSCEF